MEAAQGPVVAATGALCVPTLGTSLALQGCAALFFAGALAAVECDCGLAGAVAVGHVELMEFGALGVAVPGEVAVLGG